MIVETYRRHLRLRLATETCAASPFCSLQPWTWTSCRDHVDPAPSPSAPWDDSPPVTREVCTDGMSLEGFAFDAYTNADVTRLPR
jgi:hypothetical protein